MAGERESIHITLTESAAVVLTHKDVEGTVYLKFNPESNWWEFNYHNGETVQGMKLAAVLKYPVLK